VKKEYVKPYIKKQTTGFINKFGASFQKPYRNEIEQVAIEEIVKQYGSPVFVFSERKIREKYRELKREFSSRYPKVQFSWSYKTNYLDAICSIYHQEGSIAEVVSEFEYEKARHLGVPGNKIIYNGPYKPESALKIAFEEGAIVNLDHFEEIFAAEKVAKELKKKISVGIRLNMDTGIYPQWSRFGFNLENNSAYQAVKRIHKSEWLELSGLHAHIGTFILEPKAYQMEVRKMIDFMRKIEEDFHISIDSLDFGGGFPSKNKLKGTYLPAEIGVPSTTEFIEAICDTLLEELKPDEYPTVYMETGRALIDEAGFLITTVEAVKRLSNGIKSYIIDAGVNLLYTSTWYQYQVELDRRIQGAYENSVVYGPLCMNIDIVLENIMLPPLTPGVRMILSPLGAYNVTQWMQFIRYRPAVVMITEEKTIELIRRSENLMDVIGPEIIPEKCKHFTL
jgi:diaminopimelate decarboxylase